MGLGRLMKTGLVVKATQIATREMKKPENQRKAKELLSKVTNRGNSGKSGRQPGTN